MAGNDAAQKLVEALNEGSDALIDAIRAANDRGHRVSTAFIEQAQENQREAVELTRKWAAAPFDIGTFYSTLISTGTKAQGRLLEGARQWFTEMGDVQKETRDVMQRVMDANRKAGEAGVELARSAFSRAGDAVQSLGDGNGRSSREVSSPKAPPSGSASPGGQL